jgi:hypothetical protein
MPKLKGFPTTLEGMTALDQFQQENEILEKPSYAQIDLPERGKVWHMFVLYIPKSQIIKPQVQTSESNVNKSTKKPESTSKRTPTK